MTPTHWHNAAFDFVTVYGLMASFLTFGFCLSTLRSHIDESKIREEKMISAVYAYQIPPERILNTTGKRRLKMAKVSLFVMVTLGTATVISWYL
jgi:hypothetical protein